MLQHYFKTKDFFTDAYCRVIQPWILVLQKKSLCVHPKEAPVCIFKHSVTTYLAIFKEQACFCLHVGQGMIPWQSKEGGIGL